ncbi:hypothetical protein YOLOSWAG_150 [Erwinia phage vB_EamM_Yoloswag]|uniref:Uncharacterized protein n=1 Tax=Erwinia phage vB_EamM_Yoloswag TaxID=1958956 RepID=A0A1S6L378_9CAUD|nr:tail sheath [Erwinia phage vB_EamM_Yoloswag]AQT28630.1 hypothetical protein YOLOSWAG_150 [Erwinia phage vB_EamM_Yoloswag]
MQYLTGRSIVGPQQLAISLVNAMKGAGFTVIGVNGDASTVIDGDSKSFALEATATVDTQAADQKWVVLIAADDTDKYLDVSVLPKLQMTSEFEAAARNATQSIGRLSRDGLTANHFIDFVADWKMDAGADFAAYPLSYDLVITDHGFALQINAEGYDNTGTAFSWAVVQRGLTDGEETAGQGSPLFAIYSNGGGQNGDPDTSVATAVQRFTVIEKGINSATKSISACQPSADAAPIINPMQQVMLAEGNKAIVLFPKLINSQRYVYFVTLDLLGYTSADVISAGSTVDLTPAGTKITYRGMNANGKDNRGMRLMFPIDTPISA